MRQTATERARRPFFSNISQNHGAKNRKKWRCPSQALVAVGRENRVVISVDMIDGWISSARSFEFDFFERVERIQSDFPVDDVVSLTSDGPGMASPCRSTTESHWSLWRCRAQTVLVCSVCFSFFLFEILSDYHDQEFTLPTPDDFPFCIMHDDTSVVHVRLPSAMG